MLLVQCERLFTNEIEQQVFEDQTRAIFGVKVSFIPFSVVFGLLRLTLSCRMHTKYLQSTN